MTYAPQALEFGAPRPYCLGVDLGTTFVAAAICDGGRPEMVTLGRRSVVIPSAVYLDVDGRLLCGEAAVHRSMGDPDRAARGFFKRRLGDPTPLRIGGETRSVTQLLAALLSDVLRVVTESEGAPPSEVMLTHPANWGPFRRKVFGEVAELAGMDEVLTMTEPEAAAVHYAASCGLAEGQLVAVYDLGGGTFDTTVLHAHQDGVEILGVPEGIERLGGIDFDNALFAHLDHLCDGQLSALNADDPRAAVTSARLKSEIVLAKEHLSVDAHASIPVFLPDRTFDVHVTRTAFEDLIRAHVESTVVALQRTLRSARVNASDLDAVLLVGGSSRIPLVAEMVTEALGRPVAVDTHPKYAVALGAAALAAQVAPARQTVKTATTRSALDSGASDVDGPPGHRLAERSQALVLAGHASHLSGQTESATLYADSSTSWMSAASAVALLERFPALDEDGHTIDGRSPLALVDTEHTPADPVDAHRGRTTPAFAKVLVGALALAGITTAGLLTHRSEPTVRDVAAPAEACTTDCDGGLSPSSATPPDSPAPFCPPSSDTAPGCQSSRLPAESTAGATGNAPTAVAPRQSPVSTSNIPPTEFTATWTGDKDPSYRTHGGRSSTDKKIGKKKGLTKHSGKKSGGKHRKSSESSSSSDDVV